MPIGPNGEKRLSDPVANAALIRKIATGEMQEEHVDLPRRKAGIKGGSARSKALSSKRRSQIARDAAKARWQK